MASIEEIVQIVDETVEGNASVVRSCRLRTDGESKRALRRLRHDVLGSLRTLRMGVEALESGQTFDDERGPAKIAALARAVAEMEATVPFLINLVTFED